jgi:hypothetical protein
MVVFVIKTTQMCASAMAGIALKLDVVRASAMAAAVTRLSAMTRAVKAEIVMAIAERWIVDVMSVKEVNAQTKHWLMVLAVLEEPVRTDNAFQKPFAAEIVIHA